MSFWGELRRRNVVRAGIAYFAVAWLLIQVSDTVLPNFGSPRWVMQALIFAAALGFPVALLLAWFYDITPDGIKTTSESAPGKAVGFTGRRIDFAIIGVLILALGFLLVRPQAVSPQTGSTPAEERIASEASVLPNAFDLYLEAQDLMARWDQDDNLGAAIDLLREAATRDPSFALAFARLAEALRMQYALTGDESRLGEAMDNVNRALSLNPGLAPVQVALGRIHTTQGNFDLAFAALERALSIDPNDAAANHAMAGLYERLGRLDDAEASYRRAIALAPENLLILNGYGDFLFRHGRFEDAAGQWQALLRLAPDHYAALVNLGAALDESNRIPEAITMYQRAIEIRPTYMAYSNLGTVYAEAQRYADAVAAFEQALELMDTDWLAWGNLAYTYSWINGMEARAVDTFEHAIRLAEEQRDRNPRDPVVHRDLALYYAKLGRGELAVRRLETATTLSPDSAELHADAAEVYELIGEREEAVESVRRALELGFPRQKLQRNPELSDLLLDPRAQALP